ncbi:hypothetical protein GCM10027026_04730 [Myroides odoratimimus subsp. xuanwuensis]
MVRLSGWLTCAVMCFLTVACGGSTPSDNSLERIQSSETVNDTDAAKCLEAIPDALATANPPPVLATDRTTYEDVTEAMSAHGREALTVVPKLSADAAVTLCLLDTRAMPAAPFRRSVLAVSGDSSWWAAGRTG